MLAETTHHEGLAQLAHNLGAEWTRLHGIAGGHAKALSGPEHLAIIVDEAFSRAELALARQAGGQPVIQRYIEELLAQLCAATRLNVEAATGRRVVGSSYSVNFAAGWVMCVFRLDAQQ